VPLLRRLARTRRREFVDDPPSIFSEPETRSVLVMARHDHPFYHAMTDEDFCEWARAWSTAPQVISAEDRDRIMGRLRSMSPAWGHMEV
jgi:hypothetical protein